MSLSIDVARGRVFETLPQTRVLVTGGRFWDDQARLEAELDRLHFLYGFTDLAHGDSGKIVLGKVKCGVDKLAGEWARSRDIRVSKFPANWKKYGNTAGPIRNIFMFDTFKPAYVVVFPGGAGTRHMTDYAMKNGATMLYV